MPVLTTKHILTGISIVIALAILVSLGTWQLQRKHWKETLIADLADRAHAASIALSPPSDWASWNGAKDEFRHVAANGTFLNDKEIKVYGLMDEGGRTLQGHFLFVPLALDGGGMVLVNRGFVPMGETVIARPDGSVRVEGIFRAPEQRGWFVPENLPAKGQWYTRDTTAMAQALNLANSAPFYIEADRDNAGQWPRGGTTRAITLKNDHLQYALTWFGLALVLLGVAGYGIFRRS